MKKQLLCLALAAAFLLGLCSGCGDRPESSAAPVDGEEMTSPSTPAENEPQPGSMLDSAMRNWPIPSYRRIILGCARKGTCLSLRLLD